MAVLNSFKSIVANVTTTANTIYTAPTGYTSVILLAQVSNQTSNTALVCTGRFIRGGGTGPAGNVALINNFPVPVNDAVNLLSGKLILNTTDGIQVFGNDNTGALNVILSVLETANP